MMHLSAEEMPENEVHSERAWGATLDIFSLELRVFDFVFVKFS